MFLQFSGPSLETTSPLAAVLSPFWDTTPQNITEDTYEVGIANDMRELELRLESELEEHEKLWSHPSEESVKHN